MMYAELRRQIPIHVHNSVENPELLHVRLVHPEDWSETYPIGLIAQHGDRWHSVDEEDERHIESSLMLDVAYSLLARRIREEDEAPDWISANYPFVDYSSVFENSVRQGAKVAIHIAEHDFDRLAITYSVWSGMEGQEGRFERMIGGEAVSAHPDNKYKHAYWLRDAHADTILAGAFLDAQGAPYELWWDMGGGGSGQPTYMILTNWASERHRT